MRYATLHSRPDLAPAVARVYGRAPPPGSAARQYDPEWLLTAPLFVLVALGDDDDDVRGCALVRVFPGSAERPVDCNPWLAGLNARDPDTARELLSRAARHHRGLGAWPGKPPPPWLGLHFLARDAAAGLLDPREWRAVRRTPAGRTVFRLLPPR